VTGDGLLALWTRRAVERLDYNVVSDGRALTIEVEDGPAPRWIGTRDGRSRVFDSLDALAADVRVTDHAVGAVRDVGSG
jgi:hypothetical protein